MKFPILKYFVGSETKAIENDSDRLDETFRPYFEKSLYY